jgi:hypothetical protein
MVPHEAGGPPPGEVTTSGDTEGTQPLGSAGLATPGEMRPEVTPVIKKRADVTLPTGVELSMSAKTKLDAFVDAYSNGVLKSAIEHRVDKDTVTGSDIDRAAQNHVCTMHARTKGKHWLWIVARAAQVIGTIIGTYGFTSGVAGPASGVIIVAGIALWIVGAGLESRF